MKTKVDFVETSFPPATFDWYFPDGTVTIEENATTTPLGGPLVAFESTLEVIAGGSGSWTWSGVANVTAGRAKIETLVGEVCFDAT